MRGSAVVSYDVSVNVGCVCSQERDACPVERVVRCVVLGSFGWVRWLGWRQSACDDASLIVVLNARITIGLGPEPAVRPWEACAMLLSWLALLASVWWGTSGCSCVQSGYELCNQDV